MTDRTDNLTALPIECPHTYSFVAISREMAVDLYRSSRESAIKYGYGSAAKFDAHITAMVDADIDRVGANRDQRPSRLASFVNLARDAADTALECYAEAGMDAYFTSVHNGASHSASLSLAHGATCPEVPESDDGPTEEEREAEHAQEMWDRHNYEDPCVARHA